MKKILEFFDRELRGKLRIYITWVAAPFILYMIWRAPHPIGMVSIMAGAGLRAWASGAIEKESRLSQGGPFSFSRNPLYVGSLLITFGVLATQEWYIAGIAAVLFSAFVYHPLILREEIVLREKFNPDFDDYVSRVSRYFSFPLFFKSFFQTNTETNNLKRRVSGFDFSTFKKNKGFEPLIVGCGTIVGIFCIYLLKQRFGY